MNNISKEYEKIDKEFIFQELLKLLKLFDHICRSENIEYWIDCGTLLGAVRHKGFIPWDDDLDVSMTYENYLRFFEVCDKYLPENIKAINYSKDKNSILLFNGYLQNTAISLVDINGNIIHPFMDIFYFTSLPKHKFVRKLFSYKLKWIVLKAGNEKLPLNSGKLVNLIKRFYNFTLKFKNVEKSRYKCHKYISKKSKKYAINDKTKLVGIGLSSPWSYSTYCVNDVNCIRKEWVLPTKEILFEGFKTLSPAKTHEFLTATYGDYMTPPPIEKRVGCHIIGLKK